MYLNIESYIQFKLRDGGVNMIEWINNNKEWVFSGAGLFVVTLIPTIIKFFKNRKNQKKEKGNIDQTIFRGSNNNQAGGDIHVQK